MEKFNATCFGNLKQGDRFYFANDKQKVVYQLTKEGGIYRSSYNIVSQGGKKIWVFDKQADMTRDIIFLRNTDN